MGIGFELAETFSGSYYMLDAPTRDHALALSLRVDFDGIGRFIRERRADASGTLHAENLAEGAGHGKPVRGSVTMRLFDQKRIPYDLSFEGDDGRTYRLKGQRDFFLHDAIDSLTILPASLYDDAGTEVGRAMLRFDPKTALMPLLRSLRPRVSL